MMTTRIEHDLLLCVARRDLDECRQKEFRRFLSAPLDWSYLISTARQHGLIPLLYRHLNTTIDACPSAHFAAVKQEAIENCQSVLTLLGRLTEVLQLFNKQSIPLLVFKGPVLAEVAYGDNSFRQAGDVDILIDRQNFNRAKELLESLGYEMAPPLTASQLKAHLNFHCEIQFVRDSGFTVIDLHWSLAPKTFPFDLDTGDVFVRSRETSVGGQCFRTFGLEDLILYQSMHGAKHYWPRLEWITSLAEIIRQTNNIDWDQLIQRARETHSLKMLALGLKLAEKLDEAGIPVASFPEMRLMGSVADEMLAAIFTEREPEYSSARALKKNFKIMDRKRDVFASMLRAIFVPTLSDWQSLALPAALQPLYYFYRPVRLLKVYAASLTRRLFRVAPIASQSVEQPIPGA